MAPIRHRRGAMGEAIAAHYLEEQGWTIRERNWRCRGSEIDIIAKDDNTLVFVEVRTRRDNDFGSALESVTKTKLRALRRGMAQFLYDHKEIVPVRLDIVTVTCTGAHAEISHYRGVGQ